MNGTSAAAPRTRQEESLPLRKSVPTRDIHFRKSLQVPQAVHHNIYTVKRSQMFTEYDRTYINNMYLGSHVCLNSIHPTQGLLHCHLLLRDRHALSSKEY